MSTKKKIIIIVSIIIVIITTIAIVMSLQPIEPTTKNDNKTSTGIIQNTQGIPSSQPPTNETPPDQIVCGRNGFCN